MKSFPKHLVIAMGLGFITEASFATNFTHDNIDLNHMVNLTNKVDMSSLIDGKIEAFKIDGIKLSEIEYNKLSDKILNQLENGKTISGTHSLKAKHQASLKLSSSDDLSFKSENDLKSAKNVNTTKVNTTKVKDNVQGKHVNPQDLTLVATSTTTSNVANVATIANAATSAKATITANALSASNAANAEHAEVAANASHADAAKALGGEGHKVSHSDSEMMSEDEFDLVRRDDPNYRWQDDAMEFAKSFPKLNPKDAILKSPTVPSGKTEEELAKETPSLNGISVSEDEAAASKMKGQKPTPNLTLNIENQGSAAKASSNANVNANANATANASAKVNASSAVADNSSSTVDGSTTAEVSVKADTKAYNSSEVLKHGLSMVSKKAAALSVDKTDANLSSTLKDAISLNKAAQTNVRTSLDGSKPSVYQSAVDNKPILALDANDLYASTVDPMLAKRTTGVDPYEIKGIKDSEELEQSAKAASGIESKKPMKRWAELNEGFGLNEVSVPYVGEVEPDVEEVEPSYASLPNAMALTKLHQSEMVADSNLRSASRPAVYNAVEARSAINEARVSGKGPVSGKAFYKTQGNMRANLSGYAKGNVSAIASGKANASVEPVMKLASVHLVDAPNMSKDALARVNSLIKPLQGQEIDAVLLQRVLNELTRYYQGEGYTKAQAYLPLQSIIEGKVDVLVASARLNAVNVENLSHVRDGYLNYLLSKVHDSTHKSIKQEELNNYLLRLTDLGIFHINGEFTENDEHGFNPDLELQVKDVKPYDFTIFADNEGNESSGRYRFGGQLDVKNLTGSADSFSLFYARTDKEQNNVSLNFEIPVNSHPTVVGVNYCYSNYELAGDYKALGAEGHSSSIEAYVKEPLYRDPNNIFTFKSGIAYKSLSDEFKTFDLEFKKHSLSGYARFDYTKYFDEKYSFSSSAKLTYGHLYMDDEYDLMPENSYFIFNSDSMFSYRITDKTLYLAELNLQLASKSLDGSESFQIGGFNGLKAYESSDLAGDGGIMFKHSLVITPFDTEKAITLSPHIEWGNVSNRGDDYYETSATTGLTLGYYKYGLNLALDYSTNIGAKPIYADKEGRITFAASYSFF